jgi:hypothetical protein
MQQSGERQWLLNVATASPQPLASNQEEESSFLNEVLLTRYIHPCRAKLFECFFAKLSREKNRQNVAKKHSKLDAGSGTVHI